MSHWTPEQRTKAAGRLDELIDRSGLNVTHDGKSYHPGLIHFCCELNEARELLLTAESDRKNENHEAWEEKAAAWLSRNDPKTEGTEG